MNSVLIISLHEIIALYFPTSKICMCASKDSKSSVFFSLSPCMRKKIKGEWRREKLNSCRSHVGWYTNLSPKQIKLQYDQWSVPFQMINTYENECWQTVSLHSGSGSEHDHGWVSLAASLCFVSASSLPRLCVGAWCENICYRYEISLIFLNASNHLK